MSKEKGIQIEKLEKLIGDKFGKYSKYIIQERALPDLRDGLKPVQRRILFAMSELKLFSNSAYKKSARVVGDVIGKYHPHGDTSVYEAMVRMAQDWKLNMPLIDMHGNKGSIDGDSPAAMRYTEARLGPITKFLLENIEKNITPYTTNFDDSELEPVVFPSLYPNLIVNGSTGIAAGYATNVPPHNLNEVINALIFVLKNEDVRLSDVMKYIKGPDFPTGGSLQSREFVKQAYKTGKGKIIIRAKVEYNSKLKSIIITEIPFETNKSDIVKQIDELIRNSKIPGIKEVRDDSDRQGLQITIECKPGLNIENAINYLYKATDLQKNYSINMVAIKDKKPQLLSMIDILDSFKEFQISIFKNLYNFELEKAKKRLEIVDGLIKASSIIDQVVSVIKNSKSKSDSRNNIIKKFGFSEFQAEAIINLKLYRLSSTDIVQLQEEKLMLENLIKHYTKGLKNKEYLISNIIIELENLNKQFKTPRRTIVEEKVEELSIDETALIQKEDVYLVATRNGYVKKVSTRSKETSGDQETGIRENDLVVVNKLIPNMNNIFFFTNSGKYYNILIHKMSEFKWKDVGEHFGKYFSIAGGEKIIGATFSVNFEEQKSETLLITTKNGLIKQVLIKDIQLAGSKKGFKFINLKGDDEVVSVNVCCDQKGFVTSITKEGKIIRYSLSEVPVIGLNTSGVRNIKLESDDYVISSIMSSQSEIKEDNAQVILLLTNGRAKRFRVSELKQTSRAGKGMLALKTNKANPNVISAFFDVKTTPSINILDENDKSTTIETKSSVTLSTFDEGGLVQVVKTNIKMATTLNHLDINYCKKTN